MDKWLRWYIRQSTLFLFYFQFLYCFGKEQSTPHPKRESIYWWYIYIYIWPKHPWVHKQVTPTQRICHKMWKQASGAPRIKWASNHLQSPDMKKYDAQIPQWWKFNSQFKKKKTQRMLLYISTVNSHKR